MTSRLDLRALPAGLCIDTSDPSRGIRIGLRPHTERMLPYAAGPVDCCGGMAGDTPLRSLEYAVVDVETTGGTWSQGHRVTEFCAVRVSGDGQWLDEYRTLVNPERPIPIGVAQLTSISSELVQNAPLFGDVAPEIARVLSGAVFVAHNVPFDWRFVGAELGRAGRELTGCSLCTVRVAHRVVPEVRSRSLDALTWFFNVRNEARHRAWGDARATAHVLKRLLDRLDALQIERWEQVQTLLQRRGRRKRRRGHDTAPAA